MWKQVATILAVVLVVGFLLYRMNWDSDRKNTPTKEVIPSELIQASFTSQDLEKIEEVIGDICESNEIEINSAFKKTEDLRDQLLSNHIKASSLVKSSSLIPKNLNYQQKENSKDQYQQTGGSTPQLLKMMEVDTQVPHSNINECTDFTNLPDFFNNELPGAHRVPFR